MEKRISTWYEWYWQNNPPNPTSRAESLHHLLDIRHKIVTILKLVGHWDKAVKLLRKSIELSKETGSKQNQLVLKMELGEILSKKVIMILPYQFLNRSGKCPRKPIIKEHQQMCIMLLDLFMKRKVSMINRWKY